MALIRPISSARVTKLSSVAFTRQSDNHYCTADISNLYTDYQNITIDNIICQLMKTNVGNITQTPPELTYSYDSSTGVITVYASYSMWAAGSGTVFDVFIIH